MDETQMSDAERRAWNSALDEALKITEDEIESRKAFPDGSAVGWDAACEWIGKRIDALRYPNGGGQK